MLLEREGISVNVRIEPKAPIGTANNTENGTDQLSYSAARNKNTKMIDIAKMVDCCPPAVISSLDIPENSMPYPAGSVVATSRMASIASPLLTPCFADPL